MEDEIIKLLKEISSKLDDIKSECTSINLNTYDIDKIKETTEKIQEKVKHL
ncbi:hypothetical protein CLRAG_33460 [Clostridium ragsdalei P11]|uniref:Uncharacterized protein n=1 Tax=Clostridium ragsdalei P11 TaxID=1353534 RepID=A0A1A6AL35_9CLOT|nr:hypothetical protein [Clostridium ragsdalei]OBR90698.1 hypothetical protein CLRAG_33460 [Clostridium ragsdalei P11]